MYLYVFHLFSFKYALTYIASSVFLQGIGLVGFLFLILFIVLVFFFYFVSFEGSLLLFFHFSLLLLCFLSDIQYFYCCRVTLECQINLLALFDAGC